MLKLHLIHLPITNLIIYMQWLLASGRCAFLGNLNNRDGQL